MNSSGHFRAGCLTIAITFGLIIFSGILFQMSNSYDSFSDFLGMAFVSTGLLLTGIIVALIFWIVGTGKAVKEFYVITRDAMIDIFTVRREVKQKCPYALKAMIMERRTNAVQVGVFDYSDKVTEKLTISCDGAVNNDLYVGQVINL